MTITNYDEAVAWLRAAMRVYSTADKVLAVLEREHEEAERFKKTARKLVLAWESLPEGRHSPRQIQDWLVRKMKPAIDAARKGESDE